MLRGVRSTRPGELGRRIFCGQPARASLQIDNASAVDKPTRLAGTDRLTMNRCEGVSEKWCLYDGAKEAWRTYLAKMTTATVSIAIAVRRKLWPQRAIDPSMFELL
jgi:hypothetical protein